MTQQDDPPTAPDSCGEVDCGHPYNSHIGKLGTCIASRWVSELKLGGCSCKGFLRPGYNRAGKKIKGWRTF